MHRQMTKKGTGCSIFTVPGKIPENTTSHQAQTKVVGLFAIWIHFTQNAFQWVVTIAWGQREWVVDHLKGHLQDPFGLCDPNSIQSACTSRDHGMILP